MSGGGVIESEFIGLCDSGSIEPLGINPFAMSVLLAAGPAHNKVRIRIDPDRRIILITGGITVYTDLIAHRTGLIVITLGKDARAITIRSFPANHKASVSCHRNRRTLLQACRGTVNGQFTSQTCSVLTELLCFNFTVTVVRDNESSLSIDSHDRRGLLPAGHCVYA